MNEIFFGKIKTMLIKHEGLELKPYIDKVGKLTIGVGRNLEDVGISKQEAMVLLNNDISKAVKELEKYDFWERLDEVRKAVLIDMMFNLGARKFREFKKMIAALRRGDYSEAAKEMRDSLWCEQVGSRCDELSKMMETGEWIV